MNCKKPFRQGSLAFGCGQCLPCRINRRRLWTHRMMLESLKHEKSSFVTLTYDEKNLPKGGNLVPKDTQDWLKRLRKEVGQCRYYLVGEYGDQSWRPHYHVALYGVGIEDEDTVRDTWGMGHTMVGDLTQQSAQYIAGYVTKKMTSKNDSRLNGLHPEFARMSLRPGIGAVALDEVVNAMTRSQGAELLLKQGDVPQELLHGKQKQPLGRYLRRKLRERYGFDELSTPKEILSRLSLEACEKEIEEVQLCGSYEAYEKKQKEGRQQAIANVEARSRIFKKRSTI